MSLERIIQLFENPHTEELSDRHASEMYNIIKPIKQFTYSQLRMLSHVIGLSYKSLSKGKEPLLKPLLKVLKRCQTPFKIEKSSDSITKLDDLKAFLNSLVPLLKCNEIRNKILNWEKLITKSASVISLFAYEGVETIKAQEESLVDKKIYGDQLSPLTRLHQNGNKNLKSIASSDLPETLVGVLSIDSKMRGEYITYVVEAISSCSIYVAVAQKFAQMGALKDLMKIIDDEADFRSYLVKKCIEALWNILEVGGKSIIECVACEEIVVPLKNVFERVIKQGYKLEDKCLRNELCIIINYALSAPSSHQYFIAKDNNISFLETLFDSACHDELLLLKDESIKSTKMWFSTKEEDTEFKKLLWICLLYVLGSKDNTEAKECSIKKKFIKAILIYTDIEKAKTLLKYQPPQLKEIQLQALSTISKLVLIFPEHFHQLGGHSLLIKFLSNYPDNERRLACSKALYYASKFDYFKKDFSEEGLIDILIDIIQNGKESPLELREVAFNIFSNICKDYRQNQKDFRRKGGIELIKDALLSDSKIEQGDSSTYILSALDCLCSAVFKNKRSELLFLDIAGVFVLLDLLEKCDDVHKRITLSTLSSILENKKAVNMFIEWKSAKTNINASQLLIRLYEKEDERFGVKYSDGILQLVEKPLNPKTLMQQLQSFKKTELSVLQSSQTSLKSLGGLSSVQASNTMKGEKFSEKIRKVFEVPRIDQNGNFSESYMYKKMLQIAQEFDLRSTTFAVFYRVGFDVHELTIREKQKMEIIQLYPFLRNGEIWVDIKRELEEAGIKPTNDDNHWLECSIEEAKEGAEKAIKTQEFYKEEITKKEKEELEVFYNAIRLRAQKQTAKTQYE